MQATACEIYTDVEGIFTADPRHVQAARKVNHLTYEEMSKLAASGAKVLAHSSVEYASACQVPVHVRSSTNEVEGTWVSGRFDGDPLDVLGERFVASGVAYQTGQLRCRLRDSDQSHSRVGLTSVGIRPVRAPAIPPTVIRLRRSRHPMVR